MKRTFKKGEAITIDMGDGPQEVIVMDDFTAEVSGVQFISLKPKRGAPYTLTPRRIQKVMVDTTTHLKN